jgi:hypothetical protein
MPSNATSIFIEVCDSSCLTLSLVLTVTADAAGYPPDAFKWAEWQKHPLKYVEEERMPLRQKLPDDEEEMEEDEKYLRTGNPNGWWNADCNAWMKALHDPTIASDRKFCFKPYAAAPNQRVVYVTSSAAPRGPESEQSDSTPKTLGPQVDKMAPPAVRRLSKSKQPGLKASTLGPQIDEEPEAVEESDSDNEGQEDLWKPGRKDNDAYGPDQDGFSSYGSDEEADAASDDYRESIARHPRVLEALRADSSELEDNSHLTFKTFDVDTIISKVCCPCCIITYTPIANLLTLDSPMYPRRYVTLSCTQPNAFNPSPPPSIGSLSALTNANQCTLCIFH